MRCIYFITQHPICNQIVKPWNKTSLCIFKCGISAVERYLIPPKPIKAYKHLYKIAALWKAVYAKKAIIIFLPCILLNFFLLYKSFFIILLCVIVITGEEWDIANEPGGDCLS